VARHLREHPGRAGFAAACVAGAKLAPRAPAPFALVPLVALPPAAARALPDGRVRAYATFVAHTVAYFEAFKLPHRNPARQRRRLSIEGVAELDRRLGGGLAPNARLQRLRGRPRVRWVLDRFFGLVYFGWAVERHLVLLWLFVRHPSALPRAAALVSVVFDVTLAIHAARPSAPPWWAAKNGFLDDSPLHRVTVDASRALPLVPEQDAEAAEEPNPWAAMPSPHTATAAILAVALADVSPCAAAVAGAYAVCLCVALVYLGEHYVSDVLAGLALTAAVWAAEPYAHTPARGVAQVVQA
jgi:membrane-associated phospholipid phosphatase